MTHPPANPNDDPSILDPPKGDFDLVAVDIDGTLLRNDNAMTAQNAQALRAATLRGVRVVLATARPPRSTADIYRAVGLDTLSIHYNGALICDLKTGRNIQHKPISADLAAGVIATARQAYPECMASVEILDKWYTDHYDESLPIETGKTFAPDFVGPLDSFLTSPVTKVMLLAKPVPLEKVKAAVERKHGGILGMAQSDRHLLQVHASNAGKGPALAWVAQHYGIEQSRVMAIGDAPNDVSMIEWAGLGVAMGNAWQEVLDAADVVTASNSEHGVAQAIRRYVIG